jgi:hypothetical protein
MECKLTNAVVKSHDYSLVSALSVAIVYRDNILFQSTINYQL